MADIWFSSKKNPLDLRGEHWDAQVAIFQERLNRCGILIKFSSRHSFRARIEKVEPLLYAVFAV
jgi:hypothetical protein